MNASTPPRFSDKFKLIAILWIMLSAGFLATTLISYFVSRDSVRASIIATELPLTSDNVYSEIQKDLVRPILISSMMARDTFLRDWVLGGERDPAPLTRYLKEVMAQYGMFTSFFISDATRTYYQAGGVLKKVKPDEPRDVWYFRVRSMAEPYEINVDPDLANRDKLTIFINYRVYDYDQGFIGATGVGLTVDAVVRMIDDYQQRYGRSIYFVNKEGQVVLSGQAGGVGRKSIRDIPGLAGQADAILKAGQGSFSYESGEQRHYLNVRYIPELKWYLFVVKEETQALAEVQHTLYLNLLLCGAVTAVVLLIVWLVINHYQRRLEQLATTDSLTGLANRHALHLLLAQATREASRQQSRLAAIMFDVDHFKEINDRHGHLAGDTILQGVAKAIQDGLRASDIVCRWGGEEFLVVLKNTDLSSAAAIAETIRLRIQEQHFIIDPEHTASTTISAGVAISRAEDENDAFIQRADALLYEAKHSGRNRVCTEADQAR
ncbi:MAG TPA: diguanylate cyclase [Rhodocyclaceae bacterium]|nr:diguanylate cyclase [Rhodocyclaceae bacterium]